MQRQLRLGDILDDYCPRERRLTNHAVVAMVGADVKQTRCTTCDAEHEYKHAKVPRQRRKAETPAALYSQVAAGGPKRVEHPVQPAGGAALDDEHVTEEAIVTSDEESPAAVEDTVMALPDTDQEGDPVQHDDSDDQGDQDERDDAREEGPVHRPLIRASLPRPEGQQPPQRPIPEFTIRQPGGRPNRFRPRHGRGPQMPGNRSNGNLGGPTRGGMPRYGGGRPPQGGMASRQAKRHGQGRNKRSK
jgi:hypothetical protein